MKMSGALLEWLQLNLMLFKILLQSLSDLLSFHKLKCSHPEHFFWCLKFTKFYNVVEKQNI